MQGGSGGTPPRSSFHGFPDRIVPRAHMKSEIATWARAGRRRRLADAEAEAEAADAAPPAG